ncbi:MAG TPA: hypothetical protein VNU48_02545 [Burkholderiaceae bacterium]|nr:hypothetical protein [Burkholderiaceae bacterium]
MTFSSAPQFRQCSKIQLEHPLEQPSPTQPRKASDGAACHTAHGHRPWQQPEIDLH